VATPGDATWQSNARAYSGTISGVAAQPLYTVEEYSYSAGTAIYQVTAMGFGASSTTTAIVRSTYRKPFSGFDYIVTGSSGKDKLTIDLGGGTPTCSTCTIEGSATGGDFSLFFAGGEGKDKVYTTGSPTGSYSLYITTGSGKDKVKITDDSSGTGGANTICINTGDDEDKVEVNLKASSGSNDIQVTAGSGKDKVKIKTKGSTDSRKVNMGGDSGDEVTIKDTVSGDGDTLQITPNPVDNEDLNGETRTDTDDYDGNACTGGSGGPGERLTWRRLQ